LIRILFLSANPVNTPHILLSQEYNDINDGFKMVPSRDQFDLVQRPGISINDLQRIWMENDPQILHFSGHGSDIDGLIFENEEGNAENVSPKYLSDLFKVLGKNIRLVFLNACYTATQAEEISKHVDFVIGTVSAIGDKTARVFAKYFYQAFGFGKSIQDAFELAKIQLKFLNVSDEQMPVLLKRDGPILNHSTPPEPPTSPSNNNLTGAEIGKEIEDLDQSYDKLIEGKLNIEEFWNILLPILRKLSSSQEGRRLIGEQNARSLNLNLINISTTIGDYRTKGDMGDSSGQSYVDKQLRILFSQVIRKMHDIFSSL